MRRASASDDNRAYLEHAFIAPTYQLHPAQTARGRVAPTSVANVVTPVRLPPGRLRLATTPILIGSSPVTKTIGIMEVVALAASTAGVPSAAITVT
jgi:hypothetical protein